MALNSSCSQTCASSELLPREHLNHGWKETSSFPQASPAAVVLALGSQELISGLGLEKAGSELQSWGWQEDKREQAIYDWGGRRGER